MVYHTWTLSLYFWIYKKCRFALGVKGLQTIESPGIHGIEIQAQWTQELLALNVCRFHLGRMPSALHCGMNCVWRPCICLIVFHFPSRFNCMRHAKCPSVEGRMKHLMTLIISLTRASDNVERMRGPVSSWQHKIKGLRRMIRSSLWQMYTLSVSGSCLFIEHPRLNFFS